MSKSFSPPLDLAHGRVERAHGAGGRAMTQLIEDLFVSAFDSPALAKGNDQAVLTAPTGRLAMATDGFVISPLVFPGGDIGSLAVHGTVNDLAMAGAKPLYLAVGMILEEGLPLSDLATVAGSMARAAREAGVTIVTGDTKVVEHGSCDGLFITTTGIGVIQDDRLALSGDRAEPGDVLLVSGTLGDHGVAVLSVRENLTFESPVLSDSAPLHDLVEAMVREVPTLKTLRDPTRGGLAATLNELARQSRVGMRLRESAIPVRAVVRGACELLGLDVLSIANEGKLVAVCPPNEAEALLKVMRSHPLGREAAIIGEVTKGPAGQVEMETSLGGRRIVDWLSGDPLPRIC